MSFLWDIGLEVGHSVRTVAECAEESIADVGVMTTLLEARALAGNATLLPAMRVALAPDRVWPVRDYFAAKVREQHERHLKANDTAYNLEPNVKTGPGGLRDIQTIAWVAKRHFGAESLDELATHGFLTASELRRLKQAQAFLWKVRFGLHVLTGRHEDRLLFDHQIKLAQQLRLRGRHLYARGRAADAALLPHRDGRAAAQRTAAAAVPRSDPHRRHAAASR